VLPPVADSTLINGLGRYVGGPASPLSVINVNPGKRYRFRLLSMACDSSFNFSIDGHRMTIIEADGEPTLPLQVDFIQIFAGQRYSFILQANQTVNNYWIRAEQQTGIDGGPTGFAGGINSAILRYAGSPNADPTTNLTNSVIPLSEGNLHPLLNPAAPGEPYVGGADVLLNLQFALNGVTLSINSVSYKPPSVPVLLQILNGAKTAADLLPTGSIYVLPPNKVIEISMVDNAQVGPWVSDKFFCLGISMLKVPCFSILFTSTECVIFSPVFFSKNFIHFFHSMPLVSLELRGLATIIM